MKTKLMFIWLMLSAIIGYTQSMTNNNAIFLANLDTYTNHEFIENDEVYVTTIDGTVVGTSIWKDNNIDPDITTMSVVVVIWGYDSSAQEYPEEGDTLLYYLVDQNNDVWRANYMTFEEGIGLTDGSNYLPDGLFVADTIFWDKNISIDNVSDLNVKIYPNPANETLTILNGNNDRISIYNVSGQLKHTFDLNENIYYINTTKWDRGLYFILFEKSRQSFKIVVN